MFQNFLHFLTRNRSLLLITAFLVVSTGALVVLQYDDIRGYLQSVNPADPGADHPQVIRSNGAIQGGSTGMDEETRPVSISLSEGKAVSKAYEPLPVATGVPLDEAQAAEILARLPEITAGEGDQTGFNLAGELLPPPLPGQTVPQAFPPAAEAAPPETAAAGPLQVLRFAPEGEVKIAPFLNVTFNQPMVALATIGDLAAADVPVRIDPPIEGTWRWLGTRTLNFQYDSALIDRLPKATTYHVTIPAGTKSATGGVLAETVAWSFTTPPPAMTLSYPPDEPQSLEPLFFVQFDQRIDPAAVLEFTKVTAGGKAVSLALVNEAAVSENEKTNSLLKDAVAGRWMAFKATQPLPADARIQVEIGPGAPSAEGPLTTTAAQSYSFSTYAPLRVEEHGCSWGGEQCQPLTPFFIRFNNPIDAENYTEEMIRVDPQLPGASINIYGNNLEIQGQSKGQTTYTVTISGEIQDAFGQKLGKDTRLTFRVGPAEPMLYGSGNTFVTLDPAMRKPVFSVYSLNYTSLDLKIYAVQPTDWPAYQNYLREWQRTDVAVELPGRQVVSRALPVESAADALTEVNIDLSEYMDGQFGHFIVKVSPPAGLLNLNKDAAYWQTIHAWVQVTQIGVDAFADHSEMVVWTTALKDGAPLGDISITNYPSGWQAQTGADGTLRYPIQNGTSFLVASQGADQALLPHSSYSWGDDGWYQRSVSDMLRWYIFDDRQMYRPGEEVHIKGWLRRVGGRQDGDVSLVDGLSGVSYRIIDPQGNELGSGQVETNALNGFDFSFTLPEVINLGYAYIELNASGSLSGFDSLQTSHSFQVQEFRRPEFEVTARNETAGPYFLGDSATVAVAASYYAGGALPNAEVTWQVTSTPGSYSPPNWPGFTFGVWTPWWWGGRDVLVEKAYGPYSGEGTKIETFSGSTDAAGEHYLNLDFSQEGDPKPVSVTAEATVMDVNRQAWTGSTTLLVHPANLYIGLRSERYFVARGTPLKIEFIVTDLDGNPVADRPVQVRAARLEWKYSAGEWSEQEADVQTCATGSGTEPQTCSFTTEIGGSYRITGEVLDDLGRKNQSQLTRWVSGGEAPPSRKVELEEVTLIPDKETYQPGDTAQILVQSPFSPAEGLLTVNRSGLLYTQRFTIQDGSTTLSIPIEAAHIPNLNVQVDLTGAAQRSDDLGEPLPGVEPRPAFASGSLNLPIPPLERTLHADLLVEPGELEPGGETSLQVALRDAAGQPVAGAELAVVVVDEAILALTDYQLADPLAIFYPERGLDWMSVYGRSSIVLANPQALANQTNNLRDTSLRSVAKEEMEMPAAAQDAAAAPMATMAAGEMGNGGGAQQSQNIYVRTDFNPLANFSPAVTTDAEGRASLPIKLPDNLTRYRVMVAAVADGRLYGTAETNLTARLPLMVRPSAPRFLNFGDQFELPVVLQNQTDQDMTVDVAARAENLTFTGPAGLRVTVPARDRVEVRFPAAAEMAGTARLQIAAVEVNGAAADAATIELPVYTPATTEAFATYGVVDEGAVAQPVAAPTDVYPQYGGLEITTSSTSLQALTDAVLYLVAYPYECSEQIASRVLGIAALKDVLTAFQAEGLPSAEEMNARVQADIDILKGLQNADGGFPYWRRGQESNPFNTIHVAHALARARAKDYSVPQEMQQPLLEYLRNIENFYPSYYSQETRRTLSAYALYVRDLYGDGDPAKALKLIDEAGLENLSLDAVGWLWPVLQDAPAASARLEEIRLLVNNRAVETAGAANFTSQYDDQNYLLLGSDRRTDAILLDALMIDNPQHDLIPKLVNGLLAHRTSGRWMNTQENVFVLLSLDRYFNTYEAQTPDFVAQVWLGENYAGSYEFRGRSTDRNETKVPMTYLVDPALGGGVTQNLIINKEGAGRLYYRLGLRYAPTSLEQDALDMGFIVQRTYEGIDNPEDVRQDEDGAWHIQAGARVRVRLTMVADNRRYHVALADPLPAGLEIINPDLAVSGGLPPDPTDANSRSWWWWGPWYEHQNLRDERAEAFTTLLWDGVYEYTYSARATTPGRFVVPPAKAEEMYSPEVFGRSASDVVIVE